MKATLENPTTTLKNNTGVKLSWIRAVAFVLPSVLGFLVVPTTAHAESRIVATGEFEGRSNHVVSGGVTILKTDTGYVVVLEPDFSLDGAPDPKLGFGNNGYEALSKFSELRAEKGVQATRSLPPSTLRTTTRCGCGVRNSTYLLG